MDYSKYPLDALQKELETFRKAQIMASEREQRIANEVKLMEAELKKRGLL